MSSATCSRRSSACAGELRQTTINKNYLHSVLNSMTDAVFVTSPDGVDQDRERRGLQAAGLRRGGIARQDILAVLDEREREDFDLLQAAQETRETVVRTRSGQTIPVSLTGSQIDSDDPQFQGNIFVARNITDRKRAERRIRYLARYDALTKIPNRMQFQHLLQQAIARSLRSGQAVALLYLDMDRFKEVNDTFGHGAGDRVLEVLAERLTRALPQGHRGRAAWRATSSRCSSTGCRRMPTTAARSRTWRARILAEVGARRSS